MMRRAVARAAPRRALLSASRRTSFPPAARAITTSSSMAAPANPYSSAFSPADSFQVLPESQKAGEAEDALYDAQIKEVEAWWSSPRFAGIKRPYTAADVVSKRGTQTIKYPSSVMATKLFNLIREREAKGEPIHTRKLRAMPLKTRLPLLIE